MYIYIRKLHSCVGALAIARTIVRGVTRHPEFPVFSSVDDSTL